MSTHVYTYRITLTSDAEPGTGLGGEVLNEVIPRDAWGRPVLDGSHVKGLMSQALRDMANALWHPNILKDLFGKPDVNGIEGGSLVRVGPAAAPRETAIRTVTRTAVGESGTAHDRSLRTTEVVPVGTVYEGEIETVLDPDSPADIAWRLALLAMPAVGGGRQRGCGLCVTSIVSPQVEKRSPGILLKKLDEELRKSENRLTPSPPPATSTKPAAWSFQGGAATLRLTFFAESPICCPEITNQTNAIESGFSIPASAVQGMLLTHLNARDEGLATALFQNEQFRAWPLQPCHWDASGARIPSNDSAVAHREYPVAIRVSLTHRTAKFTVPKVDAKNPLPADEKKANPFEDESIEHYDWTKTIDGSPLKASDGVLLYGTSDNAIRLWKAREMPRIVTAHGVHHDEHAPGGRNLFTMSAMAPMVWQGLVSVPEEAAAAILQHLDQDPRVAIGKSRSVRGFGRLVARLVPDIPHEWRVVEHERPEDDSRQPKVTLFVVQSPIRIPHESMHGIDAKSALCELVRKWAEKHKLSHDFVDAWPNAGTRFGWNRLAGKRLPACYVILPGSVFALPPGLDPQKVVSALRAGIGDSLDRQRGFGAVVVHPGKANSTERLHANGADHGTVRVAGDPHRVEVIKQVLEWSETGRKLPSASQIRAVQQRLERAGPNAAIDFLERQRKDRPPRIWGVWEPIHAPLLDMIRKYEKRPKLVRQALEVLADLSLTDKREEKR